MRRTSPALLTLIFAALAACGTRGGTTLPADATSTVGASCTVDADCRLFDDYCTGCDCRALARSEPDPKCSGPGVRCLVAPCGGKSAVCKSARCVVAGN